MLSTILFLDYCKLVQFFPHVVVFIKIWSPEDRITFLLFWREMYILTPFSILCLSSLALYVFCHRYSPRFIVPEIQNGQKSLRRCHCIRLALFFTLHWESWQRLQMVLPGLGKAHCSLACSFWHLVHPLLQLSFAVCVCFAILIISLVSLNQYRHINK